MRIMSLVPSSTDVQVGTVTWAGTNDSSVSLTPGSTSYTRTGNSDGDQTYGNVFPTIDATGLYLDIQLLDGYSTHVAWLGVCNTTSAINYSANPDAFTGWYWSGDIWYAPSSARYTVNSSTLDAAIYRIALRTESGTPKIYFRKQGGSIRGPVDVPTGSLRLMMMGQVAFPVPAATILNSGAVYQGGGGLF